MADWDLAALWEAHAASEFETRDVEADKAVWDTRTASFGHLLICAFAKQWVLEKEAFCDGYYWLTGTHQNDVSIVFAKSGLERTYGVQDAFDKCANTARQ